MQIFNAFARLLNYSIGRVSVIPSPDKHYIHPQWPGLIFSKVAQGDFLFCPLPKKF